MNTNILSVFFLAVLACQVFGQDDLYGKFDPACSTAGGICMKKSECGTSFAIREGVTYCPENEGYVCCYGVPIHETRCEKHGGMCIDKKSPCLPMFQVPNAANCKEDTHCCIIN